MDLNSNLRACVLTGKQKLYAFSDQIKQMLQNNLTFTDELIKSSDLFTEITAINEQSYTYEEKEALIAQYVNDHWNEISNYVYSTVTPEGNLIRYEIVKDDVTEELNYMIRVISPDDDTIEQTHIILNMIQGEVIHFQDIENHLFNIANGEKLTFKDICNGVQETNLVLQVAQCTSELFAQGQLTISNLKNRLDGILDITMDSAKTIINVIMENIATMSKSYENFIEFIKSLLSKIKDMTFSNNQFHWGVDTYEVNTHVFLGVAAVIQIATTIVGLVASIFAPIVGVVVTAVGSAAAAIVSSIEENSRSTTLFPSDPSFFGFGENIARTYVRDNANILYNMFVQQPNVIICVSTPFTTSIIYNQPKKDSQNYDVYPCQEFIIPFIPVAASFVLSCSQFISNGNTEQWTPGTQGISDTQYQRDYSVTINGQAWSSRNKRFNRYISLMRDVNTNQDIIHYVTDQDNDAVQRFGTWFSTLLYLYGMRSLTTEYQSTGTSNETCSTAFVSMSTTNFSSMDDILNKTTLMSFCIMCKCIYEGINLNQYNPLRTQYVGDWFWNIINSSYDSNTSTYVVNAGWYYLKIKWSDIVNSILKWEPGVTTMFSNITGTTIDNIPVEYYPMENSDPLNPSMVPPESTLNIWARLAITLGAIAVVVVAATVTATILKKRAQQKFIINAKSTSELYDTWLDDPTKANWKAYRKSCRKTNLLGKLFGLGTYDATNDWIDRPENTVGSIASRLADLSGGSDGEIDPNIADVLHSITG